MFCTAADMGNLILFIFFFPFVISQPVVRFLAVADMLSPGQSIRDGDTTLASSGQIFELGFFSPGNSKNRYLGIWYKSIPSTVAWVANRDDPLAGLNGTLTFTGKGNLVLLNQSNSAIWSSNLSRTVRNPILQLLDSGNLVLRDSSSGDPNDGYLWQSFDYPSDTLLPSMKLGWNLLTGFEKHLTSWKSSSDPSRGDYVYRINIEGLPQVELVSTGSTPAVKYRTGPFNGVQFSGASLTPSFVSRPIMVYNETEVYFWYDSLKAEYITRVTVDNSGMVQLFVAKSRSTTWDLMYSLPSDPCDNYGKCGPNGICMISEAPICQCLKGFEPRSTEKWQVLNWLDGCKRKVQMNCSAREEEGFLRVDRVKLPDLLEFFLDENMSLEDCRVECLKNCSCTAYANSKITGGGSGCIMWFGDLVDIREFQDGKYKQDIFVRLPVSELDSMHNASKKMRRMLTIGGVSLAILVLIMATPITCYLNQKRRTKSQGSRSGNGDIDLPLFDLAKISHATDNFSQTNLIGQGGFGPVYMVYLCQLFNRTNNFQIIKQTIGNVQGKFADGQEIAVKRLLSTSGQGVEEFMTEVILIAKLQHKNLVGLLGCCIEREERMLVYEYMPNKSLDHFIFGLSLFLLLSFIQLKLKAGGNVAISIICRK
ncbi:hypothetical protein CDL15_Pgr002468 [Punica granatum]|uniref:non-specific serine/threonine protein kinase n=1 Tax=Punica granatum TaxID=22663 RepID=A0A218XW17_PUNGR|nr:hypothetical protein CDL15_Pgr002468 [Punica granatum]